MCMGERKIFFKGRSISVEMVVNNVVELVVL